MFRLIILGLAVLGWQISLSQSDKPLNVVLILADDLGWNDLSFNGSHFYETPNIDQLAGQGVFFSNAYSNAPICSPSRAALLSGQYAPRTGFYTNHSPLRGENSWRKVNPTENQHKLDHSKITLADAFKANGYKTIHLGKWHLGDTPDNYPDKHGFDINIAGSKLGKPNTYFSPYDMPNLENGPDGEYLTERLTNEAINFVKNSKDEPFFVYMAYHSPHTPIQAKDSLIRKYIPKEHVNGQNDPIYAAMIETLDYNVGRLMDCIKEQGLDDNTIVVFFSDNGTAPPLAPNKPFHGYKGTLYEGGIRVPLIIKSPEQLSGIVNSTPVIAIDIYPTLLELAGLDMPKNYPLDGVSLKPILEGKGGLNREAIFWHFPVYLQGEYGMSSIWRTTPVSAIRKGDYKLIEFLDDRHLELYNLRNDLGEKYNLADEYPEVASELKELLKKWREDLNVPYPLEANPYYDAATIPCNPKMGDRSEIYMTKEESNRYKKKKK